MTVTVLSAALKLKYEVKLNIFKLKTHKRKLIDFRLLKTTFIIGNIMTFVFACETIYILHTQFPEYLIVIGPLYFCVLGYAMFLLGWPEEMTEQLKNMI